MINLTAFIQVVVKLGADDTTGSSLIRRMFLFASCTQLLHIDQLVTCNYIIKKIYQIND